ncbi:MAG: DsbA family protein [Hyphomicrobium sp.]
MNKTGVLAALLLLASLPGCGGSTLMNTTALTPDKSEAGAGSPYPSTEDTAKAGPERFNPFADPTEKPVGGREVIEHPTLAEVMAPGPLPEMSFGRQDAPVTIVEYASLTCPHCRNFHLKTYPQFKKEFVDTGKVRYILREFPIGKTSGAATIALRCAPPDKYMTLFGKFMEQQPAWVSQEVRLDPIFNVAAQVGMTRQQFDACRENQAMIDGLKWVKDRGRKLGVVGTPNFFVGDKLVKKELSIEDIRAMVDPLLAGRATASAGVPR